LIRALLAGRAAGDIITLQDGRHGDWPQARRHRPRRRLACDWDGGETMDSKSTEAIKEKLDEAIKILESGLAFASVRTWGETEKRIREAIAILKEARD